MLFISDKAKGKLDATSKQKELKTAKLPTVEIVAPETVIGRTTIENIQSGLYYGTLSMIEGLIEKISHEAFKDQRPLVIGTGGFARLFEKSKAFDVVLPNLILVGLFEALKMNKEHRATEQYI